jgi:hypothetical protein
MIPMSRVILLGAGASKGTLGKQAPVALEFGKHLSKSNVDWSQEYPYLAAAIRFLKPRILDTSEESWALDKVWGAIDNRVKLRCILGLSLPGAPYPPPTTRNIYGTNLDPWGLAGFELRCAVTRVYGEKLDSRIQKAAEGNGTVKIEIEQLQSGDCVISFNYDLLVEGILERLKKSVVIANPWLDTANTHDTILLCKPHGSLNWKQWSPECGKEVQILDASMKEDEIDFDPAQNTTIQPGIAGPVPFKSEIIFPALQLRSVPNFFRLLVAQWRFAIECLSEAEKLVVLGYGFPPEDLHARYLFTEAAAKRNSDKKLEIEVYEKDKQHFDKEVMKRIDKILKPASCNYDCEYKGPVAQ